MTELYTAKQARERLKITSTELRRLVKKGFIHTERRSTSDRDFYVKEDVERVAKEWEEFQQKYRVVDEVEPS